MCEATRASIPGRLWHTRYQDVNSVLRARMLHRSMAAPKFPLTRLGMPNTTPQLLIHSAQAVVARLIGSRAELRASGPGGNRLARSKSARPREKRNGASSTEA